MMATSLGGVVEVKKKPSRAKRYAEAIIAAVIVIAYLAVMTVLVVNDAFVFMPKSFFTVMVYIVIPAAVGIGVICALVSRIKEIKGGEEDDLSNY